MSIMRQKIAEHMVYSQSVSAHVSSFFEVDFTAVEQQRQALVQKVRTVLETARARHAVVTVDSRYDLPRFKGATAAAPNEPEVEALAGAELVDERALEKAGRAVLERLEARFLLVTRGSRGMALFEREGPVTFMPIHGSDQIADVTGAGDTVISAFTVALATGAGAGEAAWLANVAGGVVVMKRGTATVSAAELSESLGDDGAAARS